MIEPMINLELTTEDPTIFVCLPQMGLFCLEIIRLMLKKLTRNIPPNINNKAGFHYFDIVKKPKTILILHIPEITKPNPKIDPQPKIPKYLNFLLRKA